ncbi:MAG: hypothetical protein Q4G63_09220 [Bacteroidia bacterium]|nr:hypothetical protein [Bacteroidia bacterium]
MVFTPPPLTLFNYFYYNSFVSSEESPHLSVAAPATDDNYVVTPASTSEASAPTPVAHAFALEASSTSIKSYIFTLAAPPFTAKTYTFAPETPVFETKTRAFDIAAHVFDIAASAFILMTDTTATVPHATPLVQVLSTHKQHKTEMPRGAVSKVKKNTDNTDLTNIHGFYYSVDEYSMFFLTVKISLICVICVLMIQPLFPSTIWFQPHIT